MGLVASCSKAPLLLSALQATIFSPSGLRWQNFLDILALFLQLAHCMILMCTSQYWAKNDWFMHLKSNNNSTARNTADHITLRHPPLKVLQSKSTWLSWFQLCFLFLPDSKRTYVEKYGFCMDGHPSSHPVKASFFKICYQTPQRKRNFSPSWLFGTSTLNKKSIHKIIN